MTEGDAVLVVRDALTTTFFAAAPVLGAALGLGIVVALFQALTQIQEMTLTFIPKIVAVGFVLFLSAGFIYQMLGSFADRMFGSIVSAGG